MDIIGFTLNPEHSEGVDWNRIAKAVPKLKVVILGRSNVIKSAISGYTGEKVKLECGTSNLRSDDKCNPDIHVPWNTEELAIRIREWQTRYDLFDETINAHQALKSRIVHYITYEELQLDPKGSQQRLFSSLDLDNYHVKVPDTNASGGSTSTSKSKSDKEKWKKRSSDDLSQVLTQYQSILADWTRGKCTCLLEQLQEKTPAVHDPRCSEIWRESTHTCTPSNQRRESGIGTSKIFSYSKDEDESEK